MAKDTIALVVSTLNNPFFVSMKDGAQQEANKLGYNGGAGFPEQPGERAGQRAGSDGARAQAAADQPDRLRRGGQRYQDGQPAKIPVITLDRVASKGDVVSHIASDNRVGGKMAGDFIAKKVGADAKVIQLEGIAGTSAARERGEGFKQSLDQNKFKLLASQPADFDRTKGLNVMQNLLTAHPDVQAVFAQNDEMALGALRCKPPVKPT